MLTLGDRDKLFLELDVKPALANFDVCRRVCDLLQDYVKKKLPPPNVAVLFTGLAGQPQIFGKSCGFFTTPIILTALVDIRRFTGFFGFKANAGGRIERRKKEKGDYDISDLGLSYSTGEVFLRVLEPENVNAAELENALVLSLTYANKVIAHFTELSQSTEIHFNHIVLASFGIDRAMRHLVYSPLGTDYPDLQIKESST
jgi:hypothetical protein